MNNYYTLIYIEKELKDKLKNAIFNFSFTTYKNVLETYFIAKNFEYRLVFSSDPTSIALFLDSFRPPKKRNAIYFFEALHGASLKEVSLMDNDRIINLTFSNQLQLRFLLFGNHPNAFLVNNANEIINTFKNADRLQNRQAPLPKTPDTRPPGPEMKTKNKLTSLNPKLPRALLKPLIRQHNLEQKSISELRHFVDTITQALLQKPCPRLLKNGEMCLWPEYILDIPAQKTFDTVNACVKYTYREGMYLKRLAKEKGRTETFLAEQQKKYKKLEHDLSKSGKSLERSETYKKTGHILMASAHRGKPDNTMITLKDIYHPEKVIEVEVDPEKTFAENAQEYYKKAEAAETDFEQSRRRLKETRKTLENIEQLQESLAPLQHIKEIVSWKKDHKEHLEALGWGKKAEGDTPSFRTCHIGNYAVWIGRNAKNNDLVTASAHKEDIWLHARGVAGSHVVLRMNNNKDYPQKTIIMKAAALAAYFSKARGSKWVPVMYTKKKYVRKPKGSPAGAVTLEREHVEMVEPKSPRQLGL